MNGQAINAVGFLMSQIRPDWDTPGCVAALRKLDDIPLPVVIIAATRYASDSTNLTPVNLPNLANRAWDNDWYLPCKVHPETRARRTDGQCAACHADRHAVPEGCSPPRAAAPGASRHPLRTALKEIECSQGK